MKAFVAIVALVACALAQSIPDNMCSVQAIGNAVLRIDFGSPETYKGAMVRVGDYVFYGVVNDKMDNIAVVLVRPDLDKTFLWMNALGCMERPALNLSTYQQLKDKTFTQTLEDPAGPLAGLITFNDSDELISETIHVSYLDEESNDHSVTVSFTYDSKDVDYDFENENENYFMIHESFNCAASSKTPAPEGKTSVQCPVGSTSSSGEIPENMCSVEAFGTAAIKLNGNPYAEDLSLTMMRVKDYAVYYFFNSTGGIPAYAAIRPDNGETYLWMDGMGCINRPALDLSSYEHVAGKTFSKTVTDPNGDLTGTITFSRSDKLSAETLQVAFQMSGLPFSVTVEINYFTDHLNYSYVNDNEYTFAVNYDYGCATGSSMPAPDATTYLQCPAPPTPSGSGSTPSGSGSTPSGSGSTPSGSGSTPSGGEIPDNMCSVQAFGTAVLMIDNANPVNYKGGMVRVGDYVMYAVYTDNDDGVAAVLVRPDLDKTFLWMNGQGCMDRPALKLSTYQPYQGKMFTQTVQDPAGPLSGLVSFDGSDKLTTESVSVYFSDGKETHSVTVSIVYDTWNYSFVNEDDDFFEMMDDFQCGASSLTPSREGKTSVQCHAPPPTPSGSTSSGKTSELPADMCSVEAEGTAVLSYDGYPYSGQLVAMMMRVNNYAQYALIDSTTGNVTAAVLIRPDTGKTYLWMAEEDCIERPALNLFSYEHVAGKTFSKTVTDPYGDLTGSITFDGSDKLFAETIQVAFTQGGQSHTVSVTITYTPNKVNYSFVNEDDDEFMAPANFECGAASMTPAADAKTSLQCSAASSTKPTPTSSSTKPTPPPPASSSAASFVVPSAMLLVAAVVAMF